MGRLSIFASQTACNNTSTTHDLQQNIIVFIPSVQVSPKTCTTRPPSTEHCCGKQLSCWSCLGIKNLAKSCWFPRNPLLWEPAMFPSQLPWMVVPRWKWTPMNLRWSLRFQRSQRSEAVEDGAVANTHLTCKESATMCHKQLWVDNWWWNAETSETDRNCFFSIRFNYSIWCVPSVCPFWYRIHLCMTLSEIMIFPLKIVIFLLKMVIFPLKWWFSYVQFFVKSSWPHQQQQLSTATERFLIVFARQQLPIIDHLQGQALGAHGSWHVYMYCTHA